MGNKVAKRLTDLELDVMKVVWELNETTIGDVHSRLQEVNKKKYAYTTVATMMKILEKKKFLKVKKVDRAHKYMPRVSKENYEESAIRHFVGTVLDSSPSMLVMKLIDTEGINKDELEKIRKSLEQRLGQ
ncbi:MAG: BlaI/MecI/CopY family transcriptional regulator [Bdellovibrionales bacterium]|nr:BlaI/MecI/CopY family transcriptional regulator [Bdellovibrionales bacterium]